MSANIPTWYYQQYNQNIQMLVQQKATRLRSAVATGTHVGNQASPVDQIGHRHIAGHRLVYEAG